MVWHVRIPVVQYVCTRQWSVQLFRSPTRALTLCGPPLEIPVIAETVCSLREQQHKQRPQLFRGMEEIVLCDLTEPWMGGTKEVEERPAQMV